MIDLRKRKGPGKFRSGLIEKIPGGNRSGDNLNPVDVLVHS